ncbi:MAG TPA: M1 family metallopeptidase, partial [Thermoanaerobaculia bacterium]|nr:M1 family metallopeptidase [Thermoanaerobaculia bacterium]
MRRKKVAALVGIALLTGVLYVHAQAPEDPEPAVEPPPAAIAEPEEAPGEDETAAPSVDTPDAPPAARDGDVDRVPSPDLYATPAPLPSPEVVASYTLDARLDPKLHRIDGSGTLRWRNPSSQPVDELCFHLYLNAFRNSASSWMREAGRDGVDVLAPDGWGWIELARLEADGVNLLSSLRHVAPDDGNAEDQTLAHVQLPRPVAPGDVLEVSMGWVSQLPRALARTGYRGDYHLVAQWFPKIGVVEEDGTWNCHQFHRSSEFYADFGNYDVTLELPQRFVVGATGRRVSESSEGRSQRLRYVQEGVHDFAWTAWPHFVEVDGTFTHPELPEVEVKLLLPPEKVRFAGRYNRALLHSLRYFGEWYGPYPYETLTMVDPPWGGGATGGMEYPTFITTGSRLFSTALSQNPEGVTVHEFGHQHFYGLLASDEVQESWLDEGINSYATSRVLAEAYGPERWETRVFGLPVAFPGIEMEHPLDVSARYFTRPSTDPVTRTTWGYLDRTSFRWMTYSKSALALGQLERLVGEEQMQQAMRSYADRYRYRHPTSDDFVTALSRSMDRDLTGYFAQTLGSAETLDYAVDSVSTRPRRGPVGVFGEGEDRRTTRDGEDLGGWESEVVVRRLGGVRLPVVVELTFEEGDPVRLRWDGEERWVRFRVDGGSRLLHAELDPDRTLLLDVDRVNDSLRVEPDRRASQRWGQR